MQNKVSISILVLFIWGFSSCQTMNEELNEIQPVNTQIASSQIMIASEEPIDITMSATSVEPLNVQTITPLPISTLEIIMVEPELTPLPIIRADQLVLRLDQSSLSARNCEVPCLLGISPKRSTVADVLDILDSYKTSTTVRRKIEDFPVDLETYRRGGNNDILIEYMETTIESNLQLPDETNGRMLFLHFESKVVTSVSGRTIPASDIINLYGMPDEVWLYSWKDFARFLPLELGLFYHDLGIAVKYSIDEAAVEDGDNVGCFDGVDGWIGLFVPKSHDSYQDWAYANQPSPVNGYYDPEQLIWAVTDLTPETFMAMFLDPEDPKCISTPAEYWSDN